MCGKFKEALGKEKVKSKQMVRLFDALGDDIDHITTRITKVEAQCKSIEDKLDIVLEDHPLLVDLVKQISKDNVREKAFAYEEQKKTFKSKYVLYGIIIWVIMSIGTGLGVAYIIDRSKNVSELAQGFKS